MTLLRYLLEYTIEVVCDGNRSACARRMGMEYSELRKIRKRMSEGSGSNRAMEALLEMYWREGLSLDEALRQYSMTELGSDIEARERACNELIRTMRETLQAESDDTVWQCNSRSKGLTPCQTPALRAETLQDAFVTAFNRIIENKEEIISICEKVLGERYDADALAKRRAELETEIEIVTELMQRQIALNATQALDQEAYQRQYDEYEARYNATRQALTEINAQQSALAARQGKIAEYISLLQEQGLITEFNESLWYATVDQVRVLADGRLRFIFKDGTRIEG